MSPKLQQFYDDIQKWIDEGFPDHHAFETDYGLCECLGGYTTSDVIARFELKSQFKDAGLDVTFPFGEQAFMDFDNLYEDPNRLKWIKDHTSK